MQTTMNIRQLKTFIALAENGTFSAAGESVGLSHSAVSLHVKALEQELDVKLVDRTKRPPVLTGTGVALVEHTRRLINILDEIAALGSQKGLIGSISVGVVPSALENLLPLALAALRKEHPQFEIRIRAGLSGELATLLRTGDIDVAIATAPLQEEGLRIRIVRSEPLFIISPAEFCVSDMRDLFRSYPFIWFSRKTWIGQQIERFLQEAKIKVNSDIEIDSIPAISALVQNGLGVSIIPIHSKASPLPDNVRQIPFGTPQHKRELALLDRPNNPKSQLSDALYDALKAVVSK